LNSKVISKVSTFRALQNGFGLKTYQSDPDLVRSGWMREFVLLEPFFTIKQEIKVLKKNFIY
jgi:hypothetical protein